MYLYLNIPQHVCSLQLYAYVSTCCIRVLCCVESEYLLHIFVGMLIFIYFTFLLWNFYDFKSEVVHMFAVPYFLFFLFLTTIFLKCLVKINNLQFYILLTTVKLYLISTSQSFWNHWHLQVFVVSIVLW